MMRRRLSLLLLPSKLMTRLSFLTPLVRPELKINFLVVRMSSFALKINVKLKANYHWTI